MQLLKEKGIPVPNNVYTVEDAVCALQFLL